MKEIKAQQYLLIDYCDMRKRSSVVLLNYNGDIVSSLTDVEVDEEFARILKLWIPNPIEVSCVTESIDSFRQFTNQLTKVFSKKERNFVYSMKTKYITSLSDLSQDVKDILYPNTALNDKKKKQKKLFQMHQLVLEYLADWIKLEKRIKKAGKVCSMNVENKTIDDVLTFLHKLKTNAAFNIEMKEGQIKNYCVHFDNAGVIMQSSIPSLYQQLLFQEKSL